jgi:hypothetical protein
VKREFTVLLESAVSVNADRSKDLTDKNYGGIALDDDLATTQCLGTKARSCDLFETTIRTLCILNLSRIHLSVLWIVDSSELARDIQTPTTDYLMFVSLASY